MPVGHVSFAYPEQSQAWDSAIHVGKMLIGSEPKVTNDLIAHAYCVVGYGLSLGFPPAAAPIDPLLSPEEFFGALTTVGSSMKADAFDWRTALRLALQIILSFLDKQ